MHAINRCESAPLQAERSSIGADYYLLQREQSSQSTRELINFFISTNEEQTSHEHEHKARSIMCAVTAKRTNAMAMESFAALSSSSEPFRPTKRRRDEVPASVSPSPSLESLSSLAGRVSASPSPRPRRRVSFSPSQPAVAPPAHWIDEGPAVSWYAPLDYALFKLQEGTDAALVRCRLEAASEHPEREDLIDVSAYRGLERLLTPQMSMDVNRRRRHVVKSVILEQRRQRKLGLNDGAELAEVSRRRSEKAAAWARTLGSL
ncbi:hypothetical protein ACHAWF_003286 [Thalassiosira exigua]